MITKKSVICTLLISFIFSLTAGYTLALPLVFSCRDFKNCTVYVDADAPPFGSGLDKDHAMRRITDAVDFIKKTPDADDYNTIYIKGGTYSSEKFPWMFDVATYKKNINIYGGWNADYSSNSAGWPTLIKLGGADLSLYINALSGVISGLEITGGGGFKAPLIINNTDSTSQHFSVIGNVFHDNLSKDTGALAIAASGANDAVVRNNVFYKNSPVGPVLYLEGNITANNNLFYNNVAGSSLQCMNGGLIYNNFFLSETASRVAYVLDKCSFLHNTLARNTLNSGDGNAVLVITGFLSTAKNNLFAYNSGAPTIVNPHVSDAVYQYNGFFANSAEVAVLGNNFMCDPKFSLSLPADMVDPKSHKLGVGSTCIDKGSKMTTVIDDYFGTLRPLDGDGDGTAAYDPGAYEAPAPPLMSPVISDLKAVPSSFTGAFDGSVYTKASFNINVASKLTVAVYSMSDVLVNKLVDGKDVSSGPQTATWNGTVTGGTTTMPSGDYNIKVYVTNSSGSDTKQVKVTFQNPASPAPGPSPAPSPAPSPSPGPLPLPLPSPAPASDRCAGFVDVLVTDALCPAVKYVKEKGIFSGYSDGSFQPKTIINRAETAKTVLLAFLRPILADDGTKLGFTDVEPGAWYMKYVRTAKAWGILQGYPDHSLKPNQQVNRVEMLKIFFTASGKDFASVMVKKAPYKDTPMDSSTEWYLKYVQYAKNYALVDASSDGYFYPSEGMKRGDVALLFYRYYSAGLGS